MLNRGLTLTGLDEVMTGDHHSVSFYNGVEPKEDPLVGTTGAPVGGFSVHYGLVANVHLRLAAGTEFMSGLRGETGLSIQNLGPDTAASILIDGLGDIRFRYNAGAPGLAGLLEWTADGTRHVVFEGNGNVTFGMGLSVVGEWTIARFTEKGFALPCRTSAPAEPKNGELFYHTTENRIYARVGSAWYKTDEFTA